MRLFCPQTFFFFTELTARRRKVIQGPNNRVKSRESGGNAVDLVDDIVGNLSVPVVAYYLTQSHKF